MSYPIFHDFCGDPAKSNLTISGANGGDLPPEELHALVGLLNNQPSVDDVAFAIHTEHRGQRHVWEALPEQVKDEWRGIAIKLLANFFIRSKV